MTGRAFGGGSGGSGRGACGVHEAGAVELLFYGELPPPERDDVEQHVEVCGECRRALDEMRVIRAALAARPAVEAPPSGDWSGFMARLDEAVVRERADGGRATVVGFRPRAGGVRALAPWLAIAATLAVVTMSLLFVARSRDGGPGDPRDLATRAAAGVTAPADGGDDAAALSAVGQQHFERSKLVLLGLAGRDLTEAGDWEYERELASRLLADTRLYRMAAEARGLDQLADVMRDLELVLLQTSMTEGSDPGALSQIQRAIRKRDLLQKMETVRTSTGI